MQSQIDKIRICFISPKAYPLFNPEIKATFGGAEVDLYYLGTQLARDPAYEITFVTADYGQREIERHENVTVIKSLRFDSGALPGAWKIWRALKKADAGIYMIKSISAGLFLTTVFCRLHRKIFLYRTAHTTHCDGTYLRRHPLMGRLFVRSIRRADAVFVQNESDKEDLLRTTGVPSTVIANGHRLNPLSACTRDIILWVGRSADFKHPERFLKLAEDFPQERFVMVCQHATGDRDYESLRQHAARISNLSFVDHVRFAEIDSWFERAKVFVNTSDAEGFPNTFIQACKAGTAILSYAVNPDGFLDRYRCGRCAGASESRLGAELKTMLESGRYAEMGQSGRAYVEQRHNVSMIAETYKQIIRELV